jgi:predicted RecA/RadA family phage recombinase
MVQVNAIKNQDYSSVNHGGIDYVPHEQTSRIQKGERIVSPKQNVQLTKAVEKINNGDIAANAAGVSVTYAPEFTVTGTDESAISKLKALEAEMRQSFMNELASLLEGRTGRIYRAVKAA